LFIAMFNRVLPVFETREDEAALTTEGEAG
jgi:hypothetical protein